MQYAYCRFFYKVVNCKAVLTLFSHIHCNFARNNYGILRGRIKSTAKVSTVFS